MSVTPGGSATEAVVVGAPPRAAALRSAAAAAAAAAEAGLLFLPLRAVLVATAVDASGGPLASYPVFLLLFASGVALATAHRASRWFAPLVVAAAAALGLAQAWWWGSRTLGSMLLAGGLALLVSLRVVSLALRDWRDPVQLSFGVGATVLLAEIVVAGEAEWAGLVPVVVLVFFVGTLLSRALSLRLAEGAAALRASTRHWTALVAVLCAVVGGLVAGALLLGGPNGVLTQIAGVVPLLIYGLILVASWIAWLIATPLEWILRAVGVRGDAISHALRRITRAPAQARRGAEHATAGGLGRVVGLLVLALGVALLVAVIVRRRRLWAEEERALEELETPVPAPPRARPGRRRDRTRRRRELPADTVRRWYAEVLVEMERRGLSRERWQTPDEYLRRAGEEVPAIRPSFTALTRAYEDVRYGRTQIPPDRLDTLEAHRGAVLSALRSPK